MKHFLISSARSYNVIAAVCAGALLPANPTTAATLELAVLRDAMLYEDATGNLASGAGDFLTAGRNNQGTNSIRRSLLQFDLTALPAGAVVASAMLRLHLTTTVTTEAVVLNLHRTTARWGAGPGNPSGNEPSGVAAVSGDSTWLHAEYPNTLWAAPGGEFLPTVSASATVSNSSGFFTWSSAQLLNDVNGWIANPQQNFGWLLRSDESAPQTAKRFESGDNTSVSFRPALVLDYSVVPEPGPWLLALGSCLPLMARRRSLPQPGRKTP